MSNIFQFFISCFKHVSYRICIANFFKPIKIFKNKFNFNNYQKTIFRLGRSIALLVVSGCSLVHVVHICRWSTGQLENLEVNRAVDQLSHLSLCWDQLIERSTDVYRLVQNFELPVDRPVDQSATRHTFSVWI